LVADGLSHRLSLVPLKRPVVAGSAVPRSPWRALQL